MKSKGGKAAKHQDSDMIFEQAYIFYRKNQNQEALVEIAKADPNEVRFMELKAQLLYRLEKGEEALELYRKLLEAHSDDYDDTRQANAMAAIALLESKGVPQQQTVHLETFQQVYNYAVHMIFQEKFAEAIKLLDDCLVKHRETLGEDGLSEQEIEDELTVIRVQKAYALQKCGYIGEAVQIYNEVQKINLSDTNLKAVVMNNLLAVGAPSSTEDISKQLRDISKKRKARLTQLQAKTIAFNLVWIRLYAKALGITRMRKNPKRRMPNNFDPNVKPDPERWLPKKERSDFQKKKKLNAKRRARLNHR